MGEDEYLVWQITPNAFELQLQLNYGYSLGYEYIDFRTVEMSGGIFNWLLIMRKRHEQVVVQVPPLQENVNT